MTQAARAQRRARATSRGSQGLALVPRAGVIALGGPPFAGRSVLAAMLADCFAHSVKLETVERLNRELFYPDGPTQPPAARGEQALLQAASEHLASSSGFAVLVLCARFENPTARRRARHCARAAGASFLFVEARSSSLRAIRRLYQSMGLGDPSKQLQVYDELLARYQAVDPAEARSLPCLRLSQVLQAPDVACARVIAAWHAASPG